MCIIYNVCVCVCVCVFIIKIYMAWGNIYGKIYGIYGLDHLSRVPNPQRVLVCRIVQPLPAPGCCPTVPRRKPPHYTC